MKFNKGIIKNINKKLLLGTLIFAFSTTPLLGCSSSIDEVKYIINKDGYITGIDGTISYKFLNGCYFVKVQNKITDEEYYTIAV